MKNHVDAISLVFKALTAEKGGVIQITTYNVFLKAHDPESADVKTFCDHVEHVRDIAGIGHVGFGSDFDGATLPECLSSPRRC